MASNPFWNPSSLYGANQDWYTTPLVTYTQEPDAQQGTFQRWLQNNNAGGFGRRDQLAQSLYSRTLSGYQAAAATNPNLLYRDDLPSVNLNSIWQSLTPEQRGEQPNAYSGRTRWMSRG
jgi:hypothetical protein